MDLAVGIALGSCIQIALFVTHALVPGSDVVALMFYLLPDLGPGQARGGA